MSTMILITLLVIFLVFVSIAIMVLVFLKFAPTFGGKPDAESLKRIHNSPYFDGKCFNNLLHTNVNPLAVETVQKNQTIDFLRNILFPSRDKNPNKKQPLLTEALAYNSNEQSLKEGEFVWLGHSTVLFRTGKQTLITDPVFHSASPLPMLIKPFKMTNQPSVADLPFIDAVLLSHDHYDHLDHKAIKQIKHKVGHFYVPLGVKAHLTHWGVDGDKVTEFDWYEEQQINADLTLIFTPTKHYSGRRMNDNAVSLWGSWVVKSHALSIYFSGDGGYSTEFTNIGKKYGGFDIAFIEDGAYNVQWQDNHMLPEQSAQAGIDVNAKVILPIHWGKFDLSTHHWAEPVKRMKSAMAKHNETLTEAEKIIVTTPKIGQVFDLENIPIQDWWKTGDKMTDKIGEN